jgi:cyanophycin synthetase
MQGFEDRLRARFPCLPMLQPSGHHDAVSLAHVLEAAALGLQAQAGCPVTFSRTVQTVEKGTFQVIVEYTEEQVGRLAFELAQSLIRSALEDKPFELDHRLEQPARTGRRRTSGPEHRLDRRCRCRARHSVSPHDRRQHGAVRLGQQTAPHPGCRNRFTSAIAESIAQDKEMTKVMLAAAGVPVPDGRSVSTAEDAWAAAQEIGAPVVIKPRDGNQGKGVAVNMKTESEVKTAFAAIRHRRPTS